MTTPDPADFLLQPGPVELAVGLAAMKSGVVPIHSVAFECASTSILGLGDSGSGKSTIAAAGTRIGAKLLSDDMVAARRTRASVALSPFRRDFVFRGEIDRVILPSLNNLVSEYSDQSGKGRLLLRDLCPESTSDSTTPNRIWSVSIDRRLSTSRPTRISDGEVLAALISSSSIVMLSPRYKTERNSLIPILKELAESCPGHRIRLGRDLMTDPEATLERLISETT